MSKQRTAAASGVIADAGRVLVDSARCAFSRSAEHQRDWLQMRLVVNRVPPAKGFRQLANSAAVAKRSWRSRAIARATLLARARGTPARSRRHGTFRSCSCKRRSSYGSGSNGSSPEISSNRRTASAYTSLRTSAAAPSSSSSDMSQTVRAHPPGPNSRASMSADASPLTASGRTQPSLTSGSANLRRSCRHR